MPGPLSEIQVIELGQGIPAAIAGMHLGDGGADVVKIETGEGDITRTWPPFHESGESGTFVALNRNKRSVSLNLASKAGRDIFSRLLSDADILIEDADLTREIGFDATEIAAGLPQLVHGRISGFGPNGPWADQPGSEIVAQMASEATTSLGVSTEPPVRLGTDAASTYAGIYAAQGVLAALFRRLQDGQGQRVDVSLFGSMLVTRATLWAALSNPDDWFGFHTDSYVKPPDHGYQAKDGEITVVTGRMTDDEWSGLFHDLGLDSLTEEQQQMLQTEGGSTSRYTHLTRPLWETGLKDFTTAEAITIFDRHGATAYRVNDYPHLFAHPQTQELGILGDVEGVHGRLPILNPPWHFSADPASVRLPPPELGQHTEEILHDLGYGSSAVAELRAEGAVG